MIWRYACLSLGITIHVHNPEKIQSREAPAAYRTLTSLSSKRRSQQVLTDGAFVVMGCLADGVVMSTRYRYGHPMVNGRRLEAWPIASYRSCWTWLRLASIPMKTSTNICRGGAEVLSPAQLTSFDEFLWFTQGVCFWQNGGSHILWTGQHGEATGEIAVLSCIAIVQGHLHGWTIWKVCSYFLFRFLQIMSTLVPTQIGNKQLQHGGSVKSRGTWMFQALEAC